MARIPLWCALVAIVLTMTTACVSDQEKAQAAQHQARLGKAAGVTLIRIVCVKDLWQRTSENSVMDSKPDATGKATPMPNGLVTVELTGPQLVDYLERLYHDGFKTSSRDPLAIRMYNGLGPVVDKIQPGAPPGEVPEVRIDDSVGSASGSPTPGSPAPG